MTKVGDNILDPLTPDQVRIFDLPSLVARMDAVRQRAEEERYPSPVSPPIVIPRPPFPLVTQLIKTAAVRRHPEDVQRRVADAAFRYLLQMDFVSVSAGIANREVFGPSYTEASWRSPVHWMRTGVLQQYAIVASRIALECFFDLLYLVHRGERMSGRSKFKTFKKWMLEEENPYTYFIGHIVKAHSFDREHRQREVHGTSRYSQSLLTLQMPSNEELNIANQLTNVLLSVWGPLLLIANDERPQSISIFDGRHEFSEKYFQASKSPATFSQFIRHIVENELVG